MLGRVAKRKQRNSWADCFGGAGNGLLQAFGSRDREEGLDVNNTEEA